jgi:hypothetical protein
MPARRLRARVPAGRALRPPAPRGLQGAFYCFIGFLAFFSSDWSLSRVCVFIVSIVGVLHLFSCKRCGADAEDVEAAAAGTSANQELGLVGSDGGATDSSSWSTLMKQVVEDSPEMLTAGLSLAGTAEGAAVGSVAPSSGSVDNSSSGGGGSGTAAAPGEQPSSTMHG